MGQPYGQFASQEGGHLEQYEGSGLRLLFGEDVDAGVSSRSGHLLFHFVEEFAATRLHEGLERGGGLGLACVVVDEVEDLGRVVGQAGVVYGRLRGGSSSGGERSCWSIHVDIERMFMVMDCSCRR